MTYIFLVSNQWSSQIMPIACSIIGCSHRNDRDKHIVFYTLPGIITNQGEECQKLSEERRRVWLSNIGQSFEGKNIKNVRVCSIHFVGGKKSYLYDRTSLNWAPTEKLRNKKNTTDLMSSSGSRHKRLTERKKTKLGMDERNVELDIIMDDEPETKKMCDVATMEYSNMLPEENTKNRMTNDKHDEQEKCDLEITEKEIRPTFWCMNCEYTTSLPHSLKEHMMEKHTGEMPNKCAQCNFICLGADTLKIHIMVEHSGEITFKCPEADCYFICPDSDLLDKHIEFAHAGEKSVKCKQLGDVNVKLKRMKKASKCVVTCPECAYTSTERYNMELHILRKHTKERPFLCSKCASSFVSQFDLRRHSTKHTNERLFPCDVCDYSAKEVGNLKRHKTNVHDKSTNFLCTFCDFKTFSRGSYVQHVKCRHTKTEELKECPFCDYKCQRNPALRIHIRGKHSSDVLHRCSKCNFETTWPGSLMAHMRNKHTTHRSLACSQCNYKTKTSECLRMHVMAIHTSVRPHKCSICDMGYLKLNLLKRHIRKKHSRASLDE